MERLAPFGAPMSETAAFAARLERLLDRAPDPWIAPVETTRALRAEGKGLFPVEPPVPDAKDMPVDASFGAPDGPRRVRLIAPERAPLGLFLHIHGGGWTFGAPELFDVRNLRLAQAAQVAVASVQYRLAPENKWPAGLEDCLAAARWAIDWCAQRDSPLTIGGESAGAHLAVATLLRLRQEGRLSAVRGAVLIYGCYDLGMTPSMANWGARNLVLSTPIVSWFVDNLLPEPAQAADPIVSPLKADLAGMPPALFQVGTADPLLDDSLFMAQRWRAAGAEARLEIWPGAPHGFDVFDRPEDGLPIARESQALTASYLSEICAAAR